jgi:chromosomal replication initiator protein
MPPESLALMTLPLAEASSSQRSDVESVPAEEADGFGNDDVQDVLRESIGDRNWHHWFAGRTAISLQDGVLRIAVASRFLQSWMQRRFGRLVSETVRQAVTVEQVVWDVDTTLSAGSSEQPPADNEDESPLASSSESAAGHTAGLRTPDQERSSKPAPVNRNNERGSTSRAPSPEGKTSRSRRFARLEEFVSGDCNELALTASRHVCDHPGERFNPLYLHGPVGTGKTHLAEGIYCDIRRQHGELQSLFMTCESFANQFTHALRTHALPGFRQRFRGVDVLIIDDVSFLDGKPGIQEEFLHTFEQLTSHGRQLIVTADVHPRLHSRVSEELVTRFLCGMVCRLEVPDAETRLAIVRHKAAQLSAKINQSALEYVARRFVQNVREIEGALNTLETWHVMTGKPVSLQTARQVLSDLERDCIRVIRLNDIEAAVCGLFGVESDELKSNRRTRSVSQPRMLAMFLARRHTQAAYKEIGTFFGGRNHSTVVAAEKKVEGWLHLDTSLSIGGRQWHMTDVIDSLEQQLLAG